MMKKLFFIINISFFLFMAIVGVAYLTTPTGYLELLSHFATIYFLISLIYFAFYAFYRQKLFIILSVLTCIVTTYPWIGLLAPNDMPKHMHEGDEISILQLNIWIKINSVEKVLAYIKEKKFPDIVLIQEATPHLVHQLEPLRKMYPYIVEAPEYGPFGMILFSQIPISNAVRIPFKCGDKHYTVMDFTSLKQQIPFTLIEAHTSSPERDDQMLQRNQELDELSNFISNLTTENKILIGDLNTTPYSPYFSKLLKDSGLINAMQGLRILGTWPDFLPFFLRIPIDHLLVSKNIQVLKQEVCPPVGSDHLPVLTSIKVAQ